MLPPDAVVGEGEIRRQLMIPKVIHYCWFGGKPLPKLAEKCIDSWKKFCPDYEIVRWDESNYDVRKNEYTSFCYENKKWAYLSDFARLDIVSQYGGIYFDTDVELIKPIDDLLKFEAFFGLETNDLVNTGLGFGSEARHPVIEEMKKEYRDRFLSAKADIVPVGCPKLNTEPLLRLGLQKNGKRQNITGAEILPIDYLNPLESITGRLNVTERTISIHWYSMSAQSRGEKIRAHLTRPLHRWFGKDCFERLRRKKR